MVGTLSFVGTKKQAQEAVAEEPDAVACIMSTNVGLEAC